MSGTGGARPGAGRPKTGQAMKGLTVLFSDRQLAFVDKLAARDSKSRGAIVRRLVEWAIRHADPEAL